jgi:hypothetical protein
VFLKVPPMRGVMRFGKKGKLSPIFIGPFEITQKVGKLAYRVALPPDLIGTHDVFHISMLRKYIANPEVIVEYEPLGIQEGLTYMEEPVKIVDKKEQVLRTKTISIVKVLWRNHGVEEASWEADVQIKLHSQWYEPLGRIVFAKCRIEPQGTECSLIKLILLLNRFSFNLVSNEDRIKNTKLALIKIYTKKMKMYGKTTKVKD